MTRDEMIHLRRSLILGEPPYEKDEMGALRRKTGTRGLDELKVLGDYGPAAATTRLMLEAQIKLIDHLMLRLKGDQ